jgi:nucleoid DNA-binding protein
VRKQEFVDRVASKGNMTRKEAAEAVDAVLDSISEVLSQGGEINFTGFGKFSTQHRKQRQGGRQPSLPEREADDPGGYRAEVFRRKLAEAGREVRRRSRRVRRGSSRGPLRCSSWRSGCPLQEEEEEVIRLAFGPWPSIIARHWALQTVLVPERGFLFGVQAT